MYYKMAELQKNQRVTREKRRSQQSKSSRNPALQVSSFSRPSSTKTKITYLPPLDETQKVPMDDHPDELSAYLAQLKVGSHVKRVGYYLCRKCNHNWKCDDVICEYKGIREAEFDECGYRIVRHRSAVFEEVLMEPQYMRGAHGTILHNRTAKITPKRPCPSCSVYVHDHSGISPEDKQDITYAMPYWFERVKPALGEKIKRECIPLSSKSEYNDCLKCKERYRVIENKKQREAVEIEQQRQRDCYDDYRYDVDDYNEYYYPSD